MAPAELRRLNVEHFQRHLILEMEPERRGIVERLLAEEQLKPDSAYPPDDHLTFGADAHPHDRQGY